VRVLGFVSNVHEWMSAADVIVTKAGPGTIAEACTRGLPVMLSSFLPCQEQGNVAFVVDGGFGAYTPHPEEIAKKVAGWLQDRGELERMSRQSAKHGRPSATRKIAEVIGRKWVRTDVDDLAAALRRAGAGAEHGGQGAPTATALRQLLEAARGLREAQLAMRQAKARGLAALEQIHGAPVEQEA